MQRFERRPSPKLRGPFAAHPRELMSPASAALQDVTNRHSQEPFPRARKLPSPLSDRGHDAHRTRILRCVLPGHHEPGRLRARSGHSPPARGGAERPAAGPSPPPRRGWPMRRSIPASTSCIAIMTGRARSAAVRPSNSGRCVVAPGGHRKDWGRRAVPPKPPSFLRQGPLKRPGWLPVPYLQTNPASAPAIP